MPAMPAELPPPTPPLILASESPRRTQLLQDAHIPHRVQPAQNIHERQQDEDLAPSELVEYNARLKAQALVNQQPDALILGADTLVFLDGQALGKPRDLHHAREILSRLSGRVHEVLTGVCLAGPGPGRMILFHDSTRIRFRCLGAHDIAAYLKRVPVLDKAGAYALQEFGGLLIEQIEGSPSNVIGLPLEKLQQTLQAHGHHHLLPSQPTHDPNQTIPHLQQQPGWQPWE